MTPDEHACLTEALGLSQRLGALGPAPISETIGHARAFTILLAGTTGTVVDLGSGGGVPGLVIAMERHDLTVTLVDRRQQRVDVCSRLITRLGLDDRVDAVAGDVRDLIRTSALPPVDAVVARGFGPPAWTAECALPLLAPDGLLVVSEPPTEHRWDDALRLRFGLRQVDEIETPAHVVSLRVGAPLPGQ